MYLHLGEETVIPMRAVVGIFDLENTTVSGITRAFLADAQKGGRVVNVTEELPRSFIVCADPVEGETVYISQISAATLRKRTLRWDGSGK